MLIDENKTLVDQCSKLKTLMVAYEKDALYQRLESNVSSQFYVYEVLLTMLIRTIVYLWGIGEGEWQLKEALIDQPWLYRFDRVKN